MKIVNNPNDPRITQAQFVVLLKTATLTPGIEVTNAMDGREWRDDEGDLQTAYWADGYLYNTLVAPGLEISYSANFEHPFGKPTEAKVTDDCPEPWSLALMEMTVLDDDGDPLEFEAITKIIEAETSIKDQDLTLLGVDQYEDVD